MQKTNPSPDQLDVGIVGAGVGRIYAIHKLRQIGLKVRVYEEGGDVHVKSICWQPRLAC